jgi:DNA-binding Lrp family transcriptional regulator
MPAMGEDAAVDAATLRSPDVQRASLGLTFVDSGAEVVPAAPIDDIDQALIDHLLADGKITNRELAQRIGISESVVSIRLRKLTGSGILVFTAIIDWEVAGFDWMVFCRIKTRVRSPHEVAEDISHLSYCEAAVVSLGSYDVLGYFLVSDRAELRVLTDKLAAVDGVAELDIDLAIDTALTQYGRQLFLSRNAPPIRLPAPKIDLDELDIAILQALVDDGRQSSRRIGRRFDVSEGTVRARVARLTSSGLVRVVAMVEPIAMGLIGVIAAIAIRADRSRLRSVCKELMAAPNVVFSAVCLGSWDLHALVTATSARQLMDIVGAVQAVDGVLATDAMLMVDVVRLSSYMKRLDGSE